MDYKTALDGCDVPALKKAGLNLAFAAGRYRHGIETGVLKAVAAPTVKESQAQGSEKGEVGGPAPSAPTLVARIKLSQTHNQSIDQESPMMYEKRLQEYRQRYR